MVPEASVPPLLLPATALLPAPPGDMLVPADPVVLCPADPAVTVPEGLGAAASSEHPISKPNAKSSEPVRTLSC
jgi:hypothetical protein